MYYHFLKKRYDEFLTRLEGFKVAHLLKMFSQILNLDYCFYLCRSFPHGNQFQNYIDSAFAFCPVKNLQPDGERSSHYVLTCWMWYNQLLLSVRRSLSQEKLEANISTIVNDHGNWLECLATQVALVASLINCIILWHHLLFLWSFPK